MAYALNIDLIEHQAGEDVIRISLTLWGDSEYECANTWNELKSKYEFFAAAEREGRTIEDLEEDVERPDPEDAEEEEDR